MRISDWSSDVCSSDLQAAQENLNRIAASPLLPAASPEPHRQRMSGYQQYIPPRALYQASDTCQNVRPSERGPPELQASCAPPLPSGNPIAPRGNPIRTIRCTATRSDPRVV